MKKIIMFLFIILIVTSCKIQGLTNDFSKLKDDEKMKIIELSSFDNLNNEFIYKINGLTQYINFTKTQVGPNGSLGGGTLTPNVTNNFSDYYSYGTSPSAMVTLDVVSPLSPYYPSNTNNYDGETYIIITD